MLCYTGLPKIPKERKSKIEAQRTTYIVAQISQGVILAVMYEPPVED